MRLKILSIYYYNLTYTKHVTNKKNKIPLLYFLFYANKYILNSIGNDLLKSFPISYFTTIL